MRKGYNRFNHNDKNRLTPRQKQKIMRRISMILGSIAIVLIIMLSVKETALNSKAADTYNKYYTSIEVKPGDTISEFYRIYGERYENSAKFYEEVSMINDIDVDCISAGMYVIIPYYSQEVK